MAQFTIKILKELEKILHDLNQHDSSNQNLGS